MKKLHYLLPFLFISFHVFSQKIDTLYVNSSATTYLIFDEAITLFNLGNTDFQAQTASTLPMSLGSQVLLLKAKIPNVKPTTLLLTHGKQIYQAYLFYQEPLSQSFYDYRSENQSKESFKTTDESLQLEDKFKKLAILPMNVSFKKTQSGILLHCENIYTDANGVYLKFSLHNESSIAYEIDNVSFSYQSKMKKRAINRLQSLGIEEVTVLKSFEPVTILTSQKSEKYYYYIPLYATTDNGFLEVIFREKNGLRNIKIAIPFKKILKAEML
jgi:hypothetical protein